MNTIDCGNYFVILPSTLFLTKEKYDKENDITSKQCEYGFSYNSENNENFLSLEEIKDLINKNC